MKRKCTERSILYFKYSLKHKSEPKYFTRNYTDITKRLSISFHKFCAQEEVNAIARLPAQKDKSPQAKWR